MNTNHTYSPWKFRPVPSDSQDGKTSFWVDTTSGVPLADVRTRPANESEANARLIAAAPDLLRELDNARSLIQSFYAGENVPPALVENALYEIGQALEKATGNSM